MNPFGDFYSGRTVIVTGHTGFKGSWLAIWLRELGARVVGYSLEPPTEPSSFAASGLAEKIIDIRADVRDVAGLTRAFEEHRPEVVFHLAAQAIVRQALDDPRETFETNFMGTVNVLEAARSCGSVEAVVCITTDKVYENREWEWGYRETDRLGGHEPYGASKAAAEIAIGVYQNQRFQARMSGDASGVLPVSSVRAGNVVGGGDWARDRLIPDIVRAIAAGRDVVVRNPSATRPWQHVLESLSGYLWLGALMVRHGTRYASAYNFGPGPDAQGVAVAEVVRRMLELWPGTSSRMVVDADVSGVESRALRLDCSRADAELGWNPLWGLDETLAKTVEWYRAYYQEPGADTYALSCKQIREYVEAAWGSGIRWAAAGV